MNKTTAPFALSTISKREVIALALIILFALLIRIPGLTDSLWFDEIWYTKTMFTQPGKLGYLLWKDVHPPTYALALLAWTDLFGDSELAVRLPSLFCSLLSIALLWFIARRWMGTLQALLVTILFALSPPHIWYSYENKVNMMLLLFTLSSVWLYWRASETRVTRDWIIATLMMVTTLYTHAYAVPVAAAIFAWLIWRAAGDRTLFRPILFSGLFIALTFAPMILLKYGQRAELVRGYLRQLSPGEVYKLLLIWLPSGNTLRTVNPYKSVATFMEQPWAFFLIEAFFAFLLGRGLWIVGRRARGDGWLKPVIDPASTEPARLILLWIAMPLAFTIAGSVVTQHFYIERNLLVILPPFLMLLVAGSDIGAPRWVRISVITCLMTLALAATINLRFLKSDVWTVYKYKPDWRAAAQYLSDEAREGDMPRVLVTTPSMSLSYYQRRVMQTKAPAGSNQLPFYTMICNVEPEKMLQEISRRNWQVVYLVRNKTWSGCWKTVWKSFSSSPKLSLDEQTDFKGLIVYKFTLNALISIPAMGGRF